MELDGMAAAGEKAAGCWRSLHALRALVLVIVLLHIGVAALAIAVAVAASSSACSRSLLVGAVILAAAAGIRISWVIGTGLCQAATAITMITEEKLPASQVTQSVAPAAAMTRIKRRMWYRRWLWWGRFGVLVTFLQVSAACYLTFLAVRNIDLSFCNSALLQNTLVILPVATWILALFQCCVGSDVLSWRSLYEMHNEAWRAHYREMFDHGIRELLCCLGRSRYMTTMDNDEVDSVAALLGDLVAYRAAGASHLEFLAGISLLRTRRPTSPLPADCPRAPDFLMKEATRLHPYAVAAYTGPLLDIGRTPLIFPCAWMYRQGLLSLWNRHRMPSLEGDNWWRGHATAFLRASCLPSEALLKGRIHQKHRETVYFVIELRELQCVLVAIRGTETPEDLLTDGLGRECVLLQSDINGLLRNRNLSDSLKLEIAASSPHYGHAGVVAAARELAFELDSPEDNLERDGVKKVGFLTSILGPGCRCEGFRLRFVGHSLGGSIAGLTGMLLCHRFPNLHVYGFGVLPCVDGVLAEACSSFMTSIVYNDEFSSRLSVASLMRLRGAALEALAVDSDTDSAAISKLARKLFGTKRINVNASSVPNTSENVLSSRRRRLEQRLKGGVILCRHCAMEMPKECAAVGMPACHAHTTDIVGGGFSCHGSGKGMVAVGEVPVDVNDVVPSLSAGTIDPQPSSPSTSGACQDVEEAVGLMSAERHRDRNAVRPGATGELLPNGIPENHDLVGFEPGADLQQLWPVELLMPGLIIHIIRCSRKTLGSSSSSNMSNDSSSTVKEPWFWKPGILSKRSSLGKQHKAILRDRDCFREIVVSPSMFLDHMPWRCQRALNDVVAQLPQVEDDAMDLV